MPSGAFSVSVVARSILLGLAAACLQAGAYAGEAVYVRFPATADMTSTKVAGISGDGKYAAVTTKSTVDDDQSYRWTIDSNAKTRLGFYNSDFWAGANDAAPSGRILGSVQIEGDMLGVFWESAVAALWGGSSPLVYASRIADCGTAAVGTVRSAAMSNYRAARITASGYEVVPFGSGVSDAYGYGISANGDYVVGTYSGPNTGGWRAFRYQFSTSRLDTLPTPSDWKDLDAFGVLNDGTVFANVYEPVRKVGRWSPDLATLTILHTEHVWGRDVSADGKVVVGSQEYLPNTFTGWVWIDGVGVKTVREILVGQGVASPDAVFTRSADSVGVNNGIATVVGHADSYASGAYYARFRYQPSAPVVPSAPAPTLPGTPVDLAGSYLAARNATVGATTDRNGLTYSASKMYYEPGNGYRHVPFFPIKTPMTLDGVDLRGKAYGFEVDLTSASLWPNPKSIYNWWAGNVPGGGEGNTFVVSAANSAGASPMDFFFQNGLHVAFYRKDGRFWAQIKNCWYAQEVALPGATSATKYRVRVDVNPSGPLKVCIAQLNGTGGGGANPPKVNVDLVGGSFDYVGLTSASFAVQMFDRTPGTAAAKPALATVSNFWTTAPTNLLYAYTAEPYLDTLDRSALAVFGVYWGNLAKPFGGYQVSMNLLGGGTGLTYLDGRYESTDYFTRPNPPVFAPNGGGRFDHAQGRLASAGTIATARLLETIGYQASSGDRNSGPARLRVLANYGASGATRLFDAANAATAPALLDSNGIVLDNAAPNLGTLVLSQGGVNVGTPKHGAVDVSIVASDPAGSGLAAAPELTAKLTSTQNAVTTCTFRLGSLDPVTGRFGGNLPLPLGTKTLELTVRVSDRVAHETVVTRTVNVVVPPSPTVTIPLQLQGFAASGNVTRVVKVILGRAGGDGIVGTKARIVITKAVTFDKTGKGTLTLVRADGLPEFADAGITHAWVKDPYHTVGKRFALTLTGAAYSAAAQTLAPGDVNNTNVVLLDDLNCVVARRGTTIGAGTAAYTAGTVHADLNGDGKVDAKDEALVNANMGRVGDPEPANY